MGTRKIGRLIASGQGSIARLREQCQRIARLDSRLRELIPAPLLEHVRLAHADAERVLLEVPSSAWLTRLRFHLPQVEGLLKRELGLRGRRVVIRVCPPSGEATNIRRERTAISEQSARVLAECARNIDDPNLAAALLRLSHRQRRQE